MVDILAMMKQAQAMQAKLQDAQEALARLDVEGRSGGGLVSVVLSGKGEMKSVHLDPSLLTPTDREMVEDLIVAAYADAKGKADRAAAESMQSLTAGLPLPPGLKLPF
jgi:DNA-binding YbaB/EbfC family protein